jgi:hypothetical protein
MRLPNPKSNAMVVAAMQADCADLRDAAKMVAFWCQFVIGLSVLGREDKGP